MSVTRWTGACSEHEIGGFVAYGDYLELQRELRECLKAIKEAEPLIASLARTEERNQSLNVTARHAHKAITEVLKKSSLGAAREHSQEKT